MNTVRRLHSHYASVEDTFCCGA